MSEKLRTRGVFKKNFELTMQRCKALISLFSNQYIFLSTLPLRILSKNNKSSISHSFSFNWHLRMSFKILNVEICFTQISSQNSKSKTRTSYFFKNILINIDRNFKYTQGYHKFSIYGTYSLNTHLWRCMKICKLVVYSTRILS